MSIARRDPFLETKTLEDRMSRWFGASRRATDNIMSAFEFAPPADVYEDDNRISLKMEVPRVKREDLHIHMNANTLSVSGERKYERDEKRENFRRLERQYGLFCRSFEVPSSADRDNITANFEDGILQIEMPKRAEAQGKQIEIGSGAGKAQVATAREKPKAA